MDSEIKRKIQDNPSDIVFPEDVLSEYAKDLLEVTESKVKAVVNAYNGAVESYTYNPFAIAISNALGKTEYNVQNDLGQIGDTYNSKFEFLILSDFLPDFKYRLLFAKCNIGGYPCSIIMEQGFAELINEKLERDGYIYTVSNSEELSALLDLVFTSDKFITLIKQIIAVIYRQNRIEE